MGVKPGHRAVNHRLRQSLAQMSSYSQEAGKGLYIGGDDPPAKHRSHHHHSNTTTSTSSSGRSELPLRSWLSRVSNKGGSNATYSGKGGGEETDTRLMPQPFPIDNEKPHPTSQPHLNLGTPTFTTPYPQPIRTSVSHSGSSYSSKQKPAHSPGPSFFRRNDNRDHSIFPFSSPADIGSPHLGDSHAHKVNSDHAHYHQTPPIDPVPTSWDVTWNQSDSPCYNVTTGSFDCWDLFGPDDGNNNGSTQPSNLAGDEYRFWMLVLVVIPLLTVFGNVLVVMSVVKEKSLKTVTNYFICSLAVADIMVAVVVMPFAVYMEITMYMWTLSDGLCDAWIASDVLGCTASILNLTAICVDRFIAVTQPIKYAKHKNSKRVFVMLAITWVISVAIAAPIALGVNYSEARKSGDCQFFNSDFIIYSSMGSFYIPSVIMCCLYWKIYRVIRLRALKAKRAKQMREVDKRALQGVIENPAAAALQTPNDTGGGYGAEVTLTTGLAKMDNGRVMTYNTTSATTSRLLSAAGGGDDNANSNSDDNSDDDDDDSGSGSANNNTSKSHKKLGVASVVMQISPYFLRSVEIAELIANPVAEAAERREQQEKLHGGSTHGKNGDCVGPQDTSASTSGGTGQTCANEAETQFTAGMFKGGPALAADGKGEKSPDKKGTSDGQKRGLTKFNFNMRVSRKRRDKSSSRREKKATKTLAIVLGVFLACWVPFFTLNIMKALCIRYDLNDRPSCQVDPIFFSLFQWLGYINSFLNPVIYTIFNQEFRKAFRKLLTDPCR